MANEENPVQLSWMQKTANYAKKHIFVINFLVLNAVCLASIGVYVRERPTKEIVMIYNAVFLGCALLSQFAKRGYFARIPHEIRHYVPYRSGDTSPNQPSDEMTGKFVEVKDETTSPSNLEWDPSEQTPSPPSSEMEAAEDSGIPSTSKSGAQSESALPSASKPKAADESAAPTASQPKAADELALPSPTKPKAEDESTVPSANELKASNDLAIPSASKPKAVSDSALLPSTDKEKTEKKETGESKAASDSALPSASKQESEGQ